MYQMEVGSINCSFFRNAGGHVGENNKQGGFLGEAATSQMLENDLLHVLPIWYLSLVFYLDLGRTQCYKIFVYVI